MKEQLISYQTAKLANLKGFDPNVKLRKNTHYSDLTESLDPLGVGGAVVVHHYYAATQSLLQKWLRETHNIYVDSYHDLTADGKNIQYYTSWGFLQQKDANGNKNVNGWYDEYYDWKTYEEALEFGLQEALKLI
jgi:hypothetical protein